VFPDEILRSLVMNLKHLERLVIANNYFLTDAGLEAIASFSSQLRHLNISNCNKVTDVGMIQVAQTLTRLQYLNVESCTRLSNRFLSALAHSCFGIQQLVLAHCASISDNGVISLAEGTPQLRYLDLSGVDRLSDTSILALARFQPLLEDLIIKNCPKITEKAIARLSGTSRVRISMEASQNVLFMRELAAKSRASSRVRVASSDDIDNYVNSRSPKPESFTFVTPELRSKFQTISKIQSLDSPLEAPASSYEPFTTKVPFATLASGKAIHCDPANLERYLSDAEFVQLFNMSPDEFFHQPTWKQKQAKARVKLF
jgi:hypothetical protein